MFSDHGPFEPKFISCKNLTKNRLRVWTIFVDVIHWQATDDITTTKLEILVRDENVWALLAMSLIHLLNDSFLIASIASSWLNLLRGINVASAWQFCRPLKIREWTEMPRDSTWRRSHSTPLRLVACTTHIHIVTILTYLLTHSQTHGSHPYPRLCLDWHTSHHTYRPNWKCAGAHSAIVGP